MEFCENFNVYISAKPIKLFSVMPLSNLTCSQVLNKVLLAIQQLSIYTYI